MPSSVSSDLENNSTNINTLQKKLQEETLQELNFFNILEVVSKKCLSEKGRELILNSRPNENNSSLNQELSKVDEMLQLLISEEELPIENIGDIRDILHKAKIENAVLNTSELLKLIDIIKVARQIKLFLTARSEKYPQLTTEIQDVFDNPALAKHISDAIDETGEIRDNATRELSRIRIELSEKSSRLRSRMNKIVKNFTEENYTQEDFYTVRDGRFVLPIKAEHKRHLPGIIHGVSQTGATVFLEPTEVIEMNNEISLLKGEEQQEIYKILKQLTYEVASQLQILLATYDTIGHIDSLHAKAHYALEFGGIRPIIHDQNEIILNKIYHPILVHKIGRKSVVPLTISFDNNKRGHLISGPNAGGKTVALKSIGLNVLLAISGFFPLGEVKTNFRFIYSAIGDHQSIENNLSTFSSQLLRLKQILDVADSASLVLIDEICSGTDPQEGGALSAGIIDTFIALNLFFIVTTHQSSLKTYALNREVIANASLEFSEEALRPTYNFLAGIPGNSYAFFLAKNIGLSQQTLNRANSYLSNKHKELEESISILQRYRKEASDLLLESQREKNKYKNKLLEYETLCKDLKNKRQQLLEKAKIEANEILQNASATVENTLREIRKADQPVDRIKAEFNKSRKQAAEEAQKIQRTIKTGSAAEIEKLTPGDIVALLDNSQTGEVLEADNNSKIALVDFNGLKFRLPFAQLYHSNLKNITTSHKQKKHNNNNIVINTSASINKNKNSDFSAYSFLSVDTRLDLRGKRADEALKEVSNFIAQAIMGNADFVTIIHGKGTGILRKVIHEQLDYMSEIKSYRLGELVEGGSGVTIVYLK